MRKKSKQKNFKNLMTPILSKLCKALRNIWNYTGSQSLKAETWNTAEFFMPVNSIQNDVVWGGLSGIAQGLAVIYFSFYPIF